MNPTIQTLPPHPALRPYVSSYVRIESAGDALFPAAPPQFASGLAFLWGKGEVTYRGRAYPLPPRYVMPVSEKSFGIQGGGADTVLGMRFFPGKFFEFFGWPQSLFYEQTIFLDDTDLGREMALLHEALDEAGDFARQAWILDRFLLARLPEEDASSSLIDWVLTSFYRSPDFKIYHPEGLPVHISPRHLRRLFREHTGFNMRTLIRILRFYRAYFHLLSGRFLSLTEVAHEASYFDQAHFDREFKRIMGMTPGVFLKEEMQKSEILAWEGTFGK